MIKAVLFDCFGVLYVDASHHFYENNIPDYENLRPELMQLNKASDYGLLTQDELSQAVADLTGLDKKFVSENIRGVHRRNAQLMDYAAGLRKTYRVGVISNISPGAMDSFFTPEERNELFDTFVMSGEEGITKPHPRIFEIAAERLGVSPGECVMLDDVDENCSGADAAGMKAVCYRSNQQAIREIGKLLQ